MNLPFQSDLKFFFKSKFLFDYLKFCSSRNNMEEVSVTWTEKILDNRPQRDLSTEDGELTGKGRIILNFFSSGALTL